MFVSQMGARIADFVSRKCWAVVGVSADAEKYGHRVFATLLNAGYEVMGVNPKNGVILGRQIYRSLAGLPVKPEVVDIVVPPTITESIVKQCADLGITRVWMQPGAESEAAIEFCREHSIEVVWGECAMVHHLEWE